MASSMVRSPAASIVVPMTSVNVVFRSGGAGIPGGMQSPPASGPPPRKIASITSANGGGVAGGVGVDGPRQAASANASVAQGARRRMRLEPDAKESHDRPRPGRVVGGFADVADADVRTPLDRDGATSGSNLYAATKGDSDVYRSEFVADVRSRLTHCLRNARDEAEPRPRVDDC